MPDLLLRGSAEMRAIFYPSWTSEPRGMSGISEEQFKAASVQPNVQLVRAKYQPHIPQRDTGRHDGDGG
jgi:hypothetical protein